MIRSVAVVHRATAEACPRAAAVALIIIGTPGCEIAVRPGRPALRLSFDTLAGELEAASSRLVLAPAAVPFAIGHARAISTFLNEMRQDSRRIDLLVCESDGHSRGVTIARWAARQLGCRLHESPSAAAVASCALMDAVLRDLKGPVQPVAPRSVAVAEPELQP